MCAVVGRAGDADTQIFPICSRHLQTPPAPTPDPAQSSHPPAPLAPLQPRAGAENRRRPKRVGASAPGGGRAPAQKPRAAAAGSGRPLNRRAGGEIGANPLLLLGNSWKLRRTKAAGNRGTHGVPEMSLDLYKTASNYRQMRDSCNTTLAFGTIKSDPMRSLLNKADA